MSDAFDFIDLSGSCSRGRGYHYRQLRVTTDKGLDQRSRGNSLTHAYSVKPDATTKAKAIVS